MAFIKKTWLARIGVGLNRFRMNNSTDVVLESNPISVTQQGDQLSADNMNNLETRIDNAFDEMAGNLAPIEVSPATTNHAVGTQLVYNGILYKVTSAISTGDNLVVNSNISPYPVSSAISDISAISDVSITLSTSEISHGNIVCKKYGKLVMLSFQEVRFNFIGIGRTLATGLPKNKTGGFFNTTLFIDGGHDVGVQIYMSADSTTLMGHTLNNSYNVYGTVFYLTE